MDNKAPLTAKIIETGQDSNKLHDAETLFSEGITFFHQDQFEQAIERLEGSLRLNPHNPDALFYLSGSLAELKRFEPAIVAVRKALKMNSNDARYWFLQGGALSCIGKQKKAIKAYDRGLSIAPQFAVVWFNRGIALAKIRKFQNALDSFEKAIQTDAQHDSFWFYCSLALISLERYQDAINHLEKTLDINPQHSSAWQNMGFALYKIGRKQDALGAYEKALSTDPLNAESWSIKGFILNELGRHDDAVVSLHRSTELRSPEEAKKRRSWKERLLFPSPQKVRSWFAIKIVPEMIDMYTRIFNLFPPDEQKKSGDTEPDSSATHAPECQYSYWASKEKCNRPLLNGYDKCFWHVHDIGKYDSKISQEYFGGAMNLRDAIEKEVSLGNSLEGAYLRKADLGGDWFKPGAMLAGAILRRADLSDAHMSCASLTGADLTMANIEGAFLSDVDLKDAKFWFAKLYNSKFRNNDLTGVKGLNKESFRGWKYSVFPVYRILEEYPDQCEPVYRSLAKHFAENGLFDDSSWATYRQRLMHHKWLQSGLSFYKLTARLMFENDIKPLPFSKHLLIIFGRWIYNLLKLVISCLSHIIWGYGERPLRVGLTAATVIIAYAALYSHNRALLHGTLPASDFTSALYFSIVTFTTLGYGDVTPTTDFRLWSASEALAGAILMGLFLFTLARRAVGRG